MIAMSTRRWFWLFALTCLSVYTGNKMGYIFPAPVQFYLNDLLAVPVAATLGMWFMRWVLKEDSLVLVKWQVIFIVTFFSLLFEGLLPLLMKRYTGDPVDIGAYIAGGFFFWKVMNR